MACPFDRFGHFPLILQAGAGDPPRKDLSLLVHQLQKEIRVLVVDVFPAVLLEAAILLPLRLDVDRLEITDLGFTLGHLRSIF